MDSFFKESNSFAVLGLSRDPKSFSRKAYDFLKKEGYDLIPINPHVTNIGGEKCYISLSEINQTQAAIFFTSPEASRKLIPLCKEKGINNLLFQFGSTTKEDLKEAKALGLNARYACVFLYHPHAGFPHNVHHHLHNFLNKDK